MHPFSGMMERTAADHDRRLSSISISIDSDFQGDCQQVRETYGKFLDKPADLG
jgi:hypothetical protein